MLTEICAELRNWFVAPNGVHLGTFTIKDGSISLPFLVSGQYFRIIGSVFNDGVHQYGAAELADETFDGAVWALLVPPAFLALADEIQSWRDQYEGAANSPFQSESFAGYSYTKATDANGAPIGWQKAFASRLNKWRRL